MLGGHAVGMSREPPPCPVLPRAPACDSGPVCVQIIQVHGGTVDPTLSSRCTHLLCESQVSGVYAQVGRAAPDACPCEDVAVAGGGSPLWPPGLRAFARGEGAGSRQRRGQGARHRAAGGSAGGTGRVAAAGPASRGLDTADTELLQTRGASSAPRHFAPLRRLPSLPRVPTCGATPKKPFQGMTAPGSGFLGGNFNFDGYNAIISCARTEVIFEVVRFVTFVPQCRLLFTTMC